MCPSAAMGNYPETANLITQCHCVPELKSFLIRHRARGAVRSCRAGE